MVRLGSIWAFGILTMAAAIMAVSSPSAISNIDNAYSDGLDTGISFLEISVKLGSEVTSISNGLDNITTAGTNINDRLLPYPQARDLREAVSDFVSSVDSASADVRSSGSDISDSTSGARNELVKAKEARERGQISRGTLSNAVFNFLVFATFAVIGVLPFMGECLPTVHKIGTGLMCCFCLWPTFFVAAILGVIAMVGSDVCFDVEDTLVAIVSFADDRDADDDAEFMQSKSQHRLLLGGGGDRSGEQFTALNDEGVAKTGTWTESIGTLAL